MIDPIRVLCVDDDAAIRDLTAEFLERVTPRITVRTAADPTAVPARVKNEDIDCLVSDYQMPTMDGLELCKRVRREHPDMPFFLFTSNTDRSLIEEALAVGATDYIEKASGIEHYTLLANRITNAVQHHRTRMRLADQASIP